MILAQIQTEVAWGIDLTQLRDAIAVLLTAEHGDRYGAAHQSVSGLQLPSVARWLCLCVGSLVCPISDQWLYRSMRRLH